jgi:hypothetical protein
MLLSSPLPWGQEVSCLVSHIRGEASRPPLGNGGCGAPLDLSQAILAPMAEWIYMGRAHELEGSRTRAGRSGLDISEKA